MVGTCSAKTLTQRDARLVWCVGSHASTQMTTKPGTSIAWSASPASYVTGAMSLRLRENPYAICACNQKLAPLWKQGPASTASDYVCWYQRRMHHLHRRWRPPTRRSRNRASRPLTPQRATSGAWPNPSRVTAGTASPKWASGWAHEGDEAATCWSIFHQQC